MRDVQPGGGWSPRAPMGLALDVVRAQPNVVPSSLPLQGGGGYEGQQSCVPKMGLSLWALWSKFHFSREDNFFLGSGVGVSKERPSPTPFLSVY